MNINLNNEIHPKNVYHKIGHLIQLIRKLLDFKYSKNIEFPDPFMNDET